MIARSWRHARAPCTMRRARSDVMSIRRSVAAQNAPSASVRCSHPHQCRASTDNQHARRADRQPAARACPKTERCSEALPFGASSSPPGAPALYLVRPPTRECEPLSATPLSLDCASLAKSVRGFVWLSGRRATRRRRRGAKLRMRMAHGAKEGCMRGAHRAPRSRNAALLGAVSQGMPETRAAGGHRSFIRMQPLNAHLWTSRRHAAVGIRLVIASHRTGNEVPAFGRG